MQGLKFIKKRMIKQMTFSVFLMAIIPMTVQTQNGGIEVDSHPGFFNERNEVVIPDAQEKLPNRVLIHGQTTAQY